MHVDQIHADAQADIAIPSTLQNGIQDGGQRQLRSPTARLGQLVGGGIASLQQH